MTPPDWLWIPITLFAAASQTLRNAAQRHLTGPLGTLGATLVRFLSGLPFALLWLAVVRLGTGADFAVPNAGFWFWVISSGVVQIAATALMLKVMAERNFALGIAYAKTEILQVALFGLVFLGDAVTAAIGVAAVCGTLGVMLLSPADREHPLRAIVVGLGSRTALVGILSGACFAYAAVGYRGAALALEHPSFLMAGAFTLVAAQAVQTLVLGGWLLARNPAVVGKVLGAWRTSLLAGLAGAAASAGWFTATAIETAVNVRTLGLVEMLFTYAVSHRFFRERLTRLERSGIALITAGLLVVTLAR
ncbi:MAG: EamA/RhaT family transporter [Burkholderiales bacterium]|nr:EamA/RhaT family transporter [Burkholderiales bacterium]